ncbi:MAG: MATE family efflux transporter [Clostridium sp.]|nr:MATE family efflux transporter [Clostridium sp.]
MNFDSVSLKKNFWRFIWPSVIAQWIFSLYTMVDGLFVARGVSEVALSAVNIASPFVHFLFSVSLLFAVGTSTIIAMFLGQDKHKDANEAYSQNLVVLGVISLVITAAVFLNLDSVAAFLGATELTMDYVKHYILSILPFSWCFIFSYSFEVLVKTDGYPKYATICVTLAALMNCILDYLFVMVFKWGVAGAGVATGLSQMMAVILYLVHFLSPRATIRFAKPCWSPGQLWRVVKIGLSSGLTEFSAGITVFLFNHAILAYIGEEGIISYTIIAYINTIVVMSMAGVAQGVQPLISFYYGRKDVYSYGTLFRYAVAAIVIMAGAAFLGSWAGADGLVSVFISKDMEELRTYSASVFRIFSISFLIMGFNVIAGGFFTAIEMPKSALAITLGRGLITMAAALAICITAAGGQGIWWAPTVSEVMCLAVSAGLMFWYGKRNGSLMVRVAKQPG